MSKSKKATPIKIKCSSAANLKLALDHLAKLAKTRGATAPLKIKKGDAHSAEIIGVPAPIPYAKLSKAARAKIDASPLCRMGHKQQQQETATETAAPSKQRSEKSEMSR